MKIDLLDTTDQIVVSKLEAAARTAQSDNTNVRELDATAYAEILDDLVDDIDHWELVAAINRYFGTSA